MHHLKGAPSRHEKYQHAQQESCKEMGEEQQTLVVEPTITWPSSEAQEDPAPCCSKPTLSLGDLPNPARRHTTPLPLLQLPQEKRNLVTTMTDNSQAPLNTHATSKQKQSFTTNEAISKQHISTATSLLLFPKPFEAQVSQVHSFQPDWVLVKKSGEAQPKTNFN